MSAAVMTLQVAGIGLLGPGLPNWRDSAALLRDPSLWVQATTVVPAPTSLPPTERRRAGAAVKAALVVSEEAVAAAGLAAASLPTVFTSSTGEPANCHALCEALASPGRMVSPTRFTNSVHNAPAGYWHIGAHSMQASTSLCAFDASFGTGLLEAAVQCASTGQPLLLTAFDVPYPEPLHSERPVADVFGVALVLRPGTAKAGGTAGRQLTITLAADDGMDTSTTCPFAAFETMRQHIPAARALPLLQLLAGSAGGTVSISTQPGVALRITVDAA